MRRPVPQTSHSVLNERTAWLISVYCSFRTERRQSRTDLPTGYAGVPVLKTSWATGPGRSAAHDMSSVKPRGVGARTSFGPRGIPRYRKGLDVHDT